MPARDDVRFIDITDTRAMDVLRSPVNCGVFEVMRRHRGGASVAELAAATGLASAHVIGRVDALVEIGLARRVPARGRTPVRFAATCDVIAIRADPFRTDHVRAVRQHFKDATSDIVRRGPSRSPEQAIVSRRVHSDV